MLLSGLYKNIIGVAVTALVVVIASAALHYWLLTISGYIGQERGSLVSIETVSYSEGAVEITVRNNGNAKTSVKYAGVEADGDTLCLTNTYLTLEPGDSNTLKLNCNLKDRQKVYTVKVVAEGGEAKYVFRPG